MQERGEKMENEFLIGLSGELDEASSRSKLNSDIESISKKLDKLKLYGELDPNEISNIEGKLKNLKASISDVTIDKKAVNGLVMQINNALQGIKMPSISIGGTGKNSIGNQLSSTTSVIDNFRKSLLNIGMSDDTINAVIKKIKNLNVEVTSLGQSMSTTSGKNGDKNLLNVDVSGVDKFGQAVKLTQTWITDLNGCAAEFVKSVNSVSTATQNSEKNINNFLKRQKTSVANLSNQIKQINAAAVDSNASRSIKDVSHLQNLSSKYDEITTAIQRMESASVDTFIDEQNNVKSLIADFKILVSEYRNAENVRTSIKPDKISEASSRILSQYKTLQSNIQAANVPLDSMEDNLIQIDSVVERLNKKEFVDKSQLERTISLIQNCKDELKALQAQKKNDTALESMKYDAESLKSTLDSFARKNIGFDKWKLEVDGVEISVESLKNELNNVSSTTNFDLIKKQADALKTSFVATKQEASTIDDILKRIDNQTYGKQYAQLVNTFRNLGLSATEVDERTKGVTRALSDLEKKNLSTLVKDEQRFADALTAARNEASILKTDLDKIYNPEKQFKLSTDIQNWLSKNTRASKEARSSLIEYYKELQGGKVNTSRLKEIEKDLKRIDAEQRGLGKLGKNLKDQFKDAGHSFTQWLSVTNGIMFLIQKSKEAVKELINVDDILTEISKTSELTKDELVKLGDAAYDTASKYGRTATDYLKGIQEMYRAGFENADEMAELSLLAQAAGDMDATGANNYIMATNAAYDYKASIEDLSAVLDSQNYITNNAAINMQDMADATSEAASVAAQYGVEIDELSALISVAVSKTRESGSEVGTALKALFINLQDTTSEPIRNAFDGVGISMTKMVNGVEKLKTPIELIKELSIAFNSLQEGSIERANILNDIGGKHHANTLAAILSDLNSYNDMLDLYAKGMGSASIEAEKSAQNITGRLNTLKNTFNDTFNNIVNSDMILSIVNGFNTVLGAINKLTDSLGTLGTVQYLQEKCFLKA